MWYPDADDVLTLHFELVALFAQDENPIDPPGPRDANLVASACMRPQTALGGTEKYRTVYDKAAALFHSIVKNHAFHNGNKRTALATLLTFLWRNDRRFEVEVSDDEVFDMVIAVANNAFPEVTEGRIPDDRVVDELGDWLRARTTPLTADPGGMSTKEFLNRCVDAGGSWKESGPSFVVRGAKRVRGQKKNIRISRSTRRLEGPVVRQYMSILGIRDVTVGEFQDGLRDEQSEIRRFREVLRRLAHL